MAPPHWQTAALLLQCEQCTYNWEFARGHNKSGEMCALSWGTSVESHFPGKSLRSCHVPVSRRVEIRSEVPRTLRSFGTDKRFSANSRYNHMFALYGASWESRDCNELAHLSTNITAESLVASVRHSHFYDLVAFMNVTLSRGNKTFLFFRCSSEHHKKAFEQKK